MKYLIDNEIINIPETLYRVYKEDVLLLNGEAVIVVILN